MTNTTTRIVSTADRDNRHTLHVHTYLTEANVASGHQHTIVGVSAPARIIKESHIHCIRIRTSFLSHDNHECSHWHWVDIMTGPAIELCNDNHMHYFCGTTSTDDGHCHTFDGITGLGPTLLFEEDDCDSPSPPLPKKKSKHPPFYE